MHIPFLTHLNYLLTLLAQAETATSPTPETSPVLAMFKDWTFYLASGIEACAGLIIGAAAVQAIFKSIAVFLSRGATQQDKENIRLNLGRWLAVALEFELAADILRTAIAPTWSEIGQLAAIIVLRTVLNYFLQQEIDKAAAREKGGALTTTDRRKADDQGRNNGSIPDGAVGGAVVAAASTIEKQNVSNA